MICTSQILPRGSVLFFVNNSQLPQMTSSSFRTMVSIHSGFGFWFLPNIPQFHTVYQSHCLFIRRTDGQIIPKLDLYVTIAQLKMLVCAHTKTSNKKI